MCRGYHNDVAATEFSSAEAALLSRYFTNLDRPVFALRNLPEVVKGALFSRYSRTEKSLRRVLLDEFINAPESGFSALAGKPSDDDDMVAVRRAEEFYERVLVGYGDDSVAELAGAHVAVERTSTLAAKALEDSRIGISPLEKSTRYVRFDRPGPDGRHLYHRGPELAHPDYEPAADALFAAYSSLVEPVTGAIRERFPLEVGETDRAWKAATRAKALDLLRGLLPAGTLTNLGLFGNGRAFEYLITKMAAHELPECQRLATDLHRELGEVIPSFVKRAVDDRYGRPSAERMARIRTGVARLARHNQAESKSGPSVKLIEHDPDAEGKVVAAALFPYSRAGLPWSMRPTRLRSSPTSARIATCTATACSPRTVSSSARSWATTSRPGWPTLAWTAGLRRRSKPRPRPTQSSSAMQVRPWPSIWFRSHFGSAGTSKPTSARSITCVSSGPPRKDTLTTAGSRRRCSAGSARSTRNWRATPDLSTSGRATSLSAAGPSKNLMRSYRRWTTACDSITDQCSRKRKVWF